MQIKNSSGLETAGKIAGIIGAIGTALSLLWLSLVKLHRITGKKAFAKEFKRLLELAEQIDRLTDEGNGIISTIDRRLEALEVDMGDTSKILAQLPALTQAIERMRADIAESRKEAFENQKSLQIEIGNMRESLGEVRGAQNESRSRFGEFKK